MPGRPTLSSEALLIHRVAYSESDWIVTLFTEKLGRISGLTRGARKSRKRFAGGFEPFHNVTVQLWNPTGKDLVHVLGSEISRPRHNLVGQLQAMQSAATGCAWIRRIIPEAQPDPQTWQLTQQWLDDLDAAPSITPMELDSHTASFGLRLLQALGWGLELSECVKCGKPCPLDSSAYLSPRSGGLVCRACGGAEQILGATTRNRLRLLITGQPQQLEPAEVELALSLVDSAIRLHAS